MTTKTKAPAFKFYPSDFIVGTAMLTAEQVGAYIRLLCYQWDIGGLPDDEGELIRLSGCSICAFSPVRAKFDRGADGLLRQHRLDAIRSQGISVVRKTVPAKADPEWLETIRAQPAYAGLDIDRELGKMRSWCEANKRQSSRRRFINWLNRADRPINLMMPRSVAPSIPEPKNWRTYCAENFASPVFLDRASPRYAETWQDLDRGTQQLITQRMAP